MTGRNGNDEGGGNNGKGEGITRGAKTQLKSKEYMK